MQFDFARAWYQPRLNWLTVCLLPFSFLFWLVTTFRRQLYQLNILRPIHAAVPVVVVGNISVGGTGKTPFVVWLVDQLRKQGYRPGIVSRGAGGRRQLKPHQVRHDDAASQVGDEALLLKKRANCPIVLCVDRVMAVERLLSSTDCNVIVSDDGLQHYRMGRQVEIAIVDGERQFGNGYLMPAGPLREPVSRLDKVDLVVVNGGKGGQHIMHLKPMQLVSLKTPEKQLALGALAGQSVHAVAGIGNPDRFFKALQKLGYQTIRHVFPDHYLYEQGDIQFGDSSPVVMTEKDAIKCFAFANDNHWYLQADAEMNSDECIQLIINKLRKFHV